MKNLVAVHFYLLNQLYCFPPVLNARIARADGCGVAQKTRVCPARPALSSMGTTGSSVCAVPLAASTTRRALGNCVNNFDKL